MARLGKQNYQEIVSKCQREGRLFEDPEFTVDDYKIFIECSPSEACKWKRPKEICSDPKYVADGISRFDVQQGELGDCWFLAAVSSVACFPDLLNNVIFPNQTFNKESYCGVFRFRFWHQGEWVEVVVDDRLPTFQDRLVYMRSADKNEFWSGLLEKAYAKLHGSRYEVLRGGTASEALVDLTGGITESFQLKDAPENLFNIMLKAHQRGSLMGCSIDNPTERDLPNGLVTGHGYSITSVKEFEIYSTRKVQLVRVRNPWGNDKEWNGAWSDNSAEWDDITENQKRQLGLHFEDDGEFWMRFQDWSYNFHKLEICNLGPEKIMDATNRKVRWEVIQGHGEWIPRVSAGGCTNYRDTTFATNPQFLVTLTDPDDDGDLCTVLIGVLQKNSRRKCNTGLELLSIGYNIYKTNDGKAPLDKNFFLSNNRAACCTFTNSREVYGRHKLSPGTYVIIPSTFEPNQQGEFLLRIFTEKPGSSSELDERTEITGGQAQSADDDHKGGLEMNKRFSDIAGKDKEVDAYELRDYLNRQFQNKFKFDGFPLDVCRSMVAMHDTDMSGKLGIEEFNQLWQDLQKWKTAFQEFDKDMSGFLDTYELRTALNSSGFRLSNRILAAVILRYSNKNGEIEFGDFVTCAIKLKTMIGTFNDNGKNGLACFHMEDFMKATMYS